MRINISDVLTKPYTAVDETVDLKIEQCDLGFGSFAVHHLEPVHVMVQHLKDKEYNVDLDTKINLNLCCDRCLREVNVPLDIHGNRHINLECSGAEEAEEFDQGDFIEGFNLDLEQLLLSELVLNWPAKVLCKVDCAGLCNVCGGSNNNKSCDCEDTSLDPRMSVVRDLFKNIEG